MSGEPVPATVAEAEWREDGWHLEMVTSPLIDGPLPVMLLLEPKTPQSFGYLFRVLHLLGVPVPPPYGEQGFWELDWSEERVAERMIGRPVMVRRGRSGRWWIVYG
jgi:hypothetical protein